LVLCSERETLGNSYRDSFGATLRFVNGDGWFTANLVLVGVVAAIFLDLYLLHFSHRKLPEAKLPRPGLSLDRLRTLWAFERVRRQFAYAVARYQRETGVARVRAAVLAANLDGALVNCSSGGGRHQSRVKFLCRAWREYETSDFRSPTEQKAFYSCRSCGVRTGIDWFIDVSDVQLGPARWLERFRRNEERLCRMELRRKKSVHGNGLQRQPVY